MSHKCAICSIVFGQYFLYKVHMELDHVFHSKPCEYKRLTKTEKAAIATRVEARLGTTHFIGGQNGIAN